MPKPGAILEEVDFAAIPPPLFNAGDDVFIEGEAVKDIQGKFIRLDSKGMAVININGLEMTFDPLDIHHPAGRTDLAQVHEGRRAQMGTTTRTIDDCLGEFSKDELVAKAAIAGIDPGKLNKEQLCRELMEAGKL